jgi:hypothetical protein
MQAVRYGLSLLLLGVCRPLNVASMCRQVHPR